MNVDQPKVEFLDTELLSQEFKVTKTTSFLDMKRQACKFWGLDAKQDHFTLVLSNMHEVMSLNSEHSHDAFTI